MPSAPPVETKSRLRQNVESLGLAVLLALVVRSSVVEAFWVPSGSMLPTIQIGDHLFVNKLAYNLNVPFLGYEVVRWGHVQRGDIVVFLSPEKNQRGGRGDGHARAAHASRGDERIDLIKRVVAIGGDTVEIRDKVLYVNGEKVHDVHAHFVDRPDRGAPRNRDNFGPVTVPEGKIFCLGDNRDHSHDSRFWGFADEEDVKGQATFIYWSRAAGEMPRWSRFFHFIR